MLETILFSKLVAGCHASPIVAPIPAELTDIDVLTSFPRATAVMDRILAMADPLRSFARECNTQKNIGSVLVSCVDIVRADAWGENIPIYTA